MKFKKRLQIKLVKTRLHLQAVRGTMPSQARATSV